MKKTLIAIAAAATISLGTAGAVSAAPNTALDVTADAGVSIEKVGYRRGYRRGYRHGTYRRGYRHGYRHGYRRHYRGYRRHYGHGYGRFYCKRLYYKGYVLGWGWARFKYLKYCARRYYY